MGYVTHQLISSSVVGVRSLIDGSQNAVWPLALEDEFRRIMKIHSKGNGNKSNPTNELTNKLADALIGLQ